MLGLAPRFCAQSRAQLLQRAKHAFQHHHRHNVTTEALSYSRPLVAPPRAPQTATVIFLHGLGDTGDGWFGIAPQFSDALPHVKFVFPTAPIRPVTLNWGQRMTAWYDIVALDDITQKEDSEGLHESKRYIEQLVQEEVAAGVPSHRVVVAGFSQGGAIALMMLRSSLKLAGVIGLSTYAPLRNEPPLVSEANKQTPVLMCHGDSDQVVQFVYGRDSYAALQQLGADVEFITFRGMGHTASPQEIEDVLEFLQQRVPVAVPM